MKNIVTHPALTIILAILLAINTFFAIQLHGTTRNMQAEYNQERQLNNSFQQHLQDEQKEFSDQLKNIQNELEASQRSFLDLKEDAKSLMNENEELKKKLL